MKKLLPVSFTLAAMLGLSFWNNAPICSQPGQVVSNQKADLELGNFSVSLAVKDVRASLEFYQKLGFKEVGGNLAQNWVILQNETSTIGLFQGMFEKNILTFNPGWDRNRQTPAEFDDVRDIQKKLKEQGLKLLTEADENSTGPASCVLADPDGNQILIDQHVKRPAKE